MRENRIYYITRKRGQYLRTFIGTFVRFARTRREDGSRGILIKIITGIRRYWSAFKSKSDKDPNKCRVPIALTAMWRQAVSRATGWSEGRPCPRWTPLRNASSTGPNDPRSRTHRGSWWYLGRTNVVRTCSRERCLVLATVAGKIVTSSATYPHKRLRCILRQLSISNLLIASR